MPASLIASVEAARAALVADGGRLWGIDLDIRTGLDARTTTTAVG